MWLGLTRGLRAVPQPQVRSHPAEGLLPVLRVLQSRGREGYRRAAAGELGPYLAARPEYDKKRRQILEEYHVPELQAQWEARIQQAFRDQGKELEWDFAVTEMRASLRWRGSIPERRMGASAPSGRPIG